MRAIWKGSISFGLVNIPVGLYSATRRHSEVKFRLLRKSDHSPIRYKRVAEADGEEVDWQDITKGYEYEKDQFVVVSNEDFKQVTLSSNQTVDIKEFVELDQVDPMFFDQPYFLAPEKGGDKAYSLLREALRKTNKVGIAKVVIKTREHLAAVKPHGQALILELMHFAEELADPNALSLPSTDLSGKEMKMAESLIDTMSGQWQPDKYKDEYAEALMELIQEKIAAGGKEIPKKGRKRTSATNVVDLVDVLQQSINQTHKSSKPKKSTPKKSRKAA